ncbi:MAG: PAS domain S-box protein [Planctomycetia bacterium]|nr:PAS domain S-box protein [Planctomycetia bacterium]
MNMILISSFLIPLILFAFISAFCSVRYFLLYKKHICLKQDLEQKAAALQKDFDDKSELFDLMVENVPIGLVLKDADNDFRFVLWNKKLEEETGIKKEDIIGKVNFDQEPMSRLGTFFQTLDQECLRRGSAEMEYEAAPPSGEEGFYVTEKHLLNLRDGRKYILSSVQNLTPIWELKKNLAATVEKQDRLIAKTQIIYDCIDFIASHHELNESYQYILDKFGSGEEALRSYLYVFNDTDPSSVSYKFEWTAKGESPIPPVLKNIDLEKVPIAAKMLLIDQKPLLIDYSEVNPNSVFMEWLTKEDIGYVIFVPLVYQDKTFGLIGFDYKERQKKFSDISLLVMNSAAHLLELIYARQQMGMVKTLPGEGV